MTAAREFIFEPIFLMFRKYEPRYAKVTRALFINHTNHEHGHENKGMTESETS